MGTQAEGRVFAIAAVEDVAVLDSHCCACKIKD